MISNYYVQFQDSAGWRNCVTMDAKTGPDQLLREMKSAQSSYPRSRIRVIDDNGRLIDSL